MFRSGARISGLLAIAVGLAGLTACLEDFEALETQVVYDPYTQMFAVERRLIGVDPSFLGCTDASGCLAAIERALAGHPDGSSMADRLLQRLSESGAEDVRLTLHQEDRRLDVGVTYRAPVGSGAADDTLVHAEWDGRGDRGNFYLVVAAQDSMEPPRKYRTRKIARSGFGQVDWVEEWVLPSAQLDVTTRMTVDQVRPMFDTVPGLAEVLASKGLFDSAAPPPATLAIASPEPAPTGPVVRVIADPPPPSPEPPRAAPSVPSPAPRPPPVPPPDPMPAAPPAPATLLGAEDASSAAKAYVYEVRVTGGGLSPGAAAQASDKLTPRIARCYQDRYAQDPNVGGTVFLGAVVRADGFVVSTSVYGQLSDRPLIACLERAMSDWTFPAWGSGDGVSEVALPVVLRVEEPPPVRGRRH